MKKFLLPAFMAFVLAFFVGCSDDDDDNPVSPSDSTTLPSALFDLTKLAAGTFTQTRTDSTNSELAETLINGTYSVKDTTVNSLAGKVFTYLYDDSAKTTNREFFLVSKDTNEFYASSSLINNIVKTLSPNPMINLPFVLPDTIIKVGDRKSTQWTAFEKTFTDFKVVDYLGKQVTANGKLNVKFTRGTAADITTDGVTNHTQIFNCIITFSGTISLDPNTTKNLTSLIQFRFANNKCIDYKYVPYSSFDISVGTFPINGIKFRLKQN